ncbi:hypothetical protein [Streptomyces hoynatensis]|uniref:FHA domain-containing protein n=1 Tax=Streptomyces hoynatensis TaxID=1141874 RepID=A0A3A9YQS8_9ACTN|nr:hypothetical protein [Streptomyces hoynatensis]RKN38323.1 hypothetical protein D7294_24700 [Streptomyces hoynatensis]
MANGASKVILLPRGTGSLSGGPPPTAAPAPAGTLFVLGANGGMSVAPDAGFTLVFGRNEPEVHVSVGGHDKHVSRRQGVITREYSRWMLTNIGRAPIRFPDSRLLLGGNQAELPTGYTPLFVVTRRAEYLLEIRVTASAGLRPPTARDGSREEETGEEPYELGEREKLVLVCLAQRYLRNDPTPQPLTWAQVADRLNALGPGHTWTPKQAAHIVAKVRRNLSGRGVSGLLDEEVAPPAGNAINHNLITELLRTRTLVKDDLSLLGD